MENCEMNEIYSTATYWRNKIKKNWNFSLIRLFVLPFNNYIIKYALLYI